MGLKLPENGYDAMVLINNLANSGRIAGVSYQTEVDKGEVVLVSIRAVIGPRIVVDVPGPIERANRGMVKLGGNGGG